MNQSVLRRDNLYVPRSYLKRWADEDGRLWSYRVLVSHPNVPLWKSQSTKSLAYHEHLYTRVVTNEHADDAERWLDADFESPAEEAIQKAVANGRLTRTDWDRLIRFLAAQDVRTPARLMENLQRWHHTLPFLVEDTLERSVNSLEAAKRDGQPLPKAERPHGEFFPGRVTIESKPGEDGGRLRFETVVGRALWLFSLKTVLTKTIHVLLKHQWTILRSSQVLSG